MRVIALWIFAACSSGPSSTPRAPAGPPVNPYVTTTRSVPEPFLGISGLTQVTVSTTTPDEWGYTTTSRVLVYRGGAVVCEVHGGSSGSHENHSHMESSRFAVSSQSPLRFRAYTISRSTRSTELQTLPTCAEYELPATGMCRQVFAQTCTEVCRVTYTTKLVPGTGLIRGSVTRAGEPMIRRTIRVGKNAEISDEHGAFAIAAGPGTHELRMYEEQLLEPKPIVPLGPNQDAELAITVACSWRTP